MKLIAYYAHCVALYGTPQEARDIQTLTDLGFAVFNPNSPEHEQAYRVKGMVHFRFHVFNCDALAFRANPDGLIPAGMAQEIDWATSKGIPVFELPSGVSRRALTVAQTSEYLHEVGQR